MKNGNHQRVFHKSCNPTTGNCQKRGIITEYLPWLLIALIALGILMIYIFVLKGEGISLIDKIKNIFSFR